MHAQEDLPRLALDSKKQTIYLLIIIRLNPNVMVCAPARPPANP